MERFTHYIPALILCLASLCLLSSNALAADCFSQSYSIEQGRDPLEDLVTRDLNEDEYDAIKDLLESLDGDWKGTAEVKFCRDSDDDSQKEIETYAVKSDCKMDSSGKFILKSTLSSREKRTKSRERLTLYLSEKQLSTHANVSESDIELISATTDELKYVKKVRRKNNNAGGPVFKTTEIVTTIQKSGASTVRLEKVVFLQGKPFSISSWDLETR